MIDQKFLPVPEARITLLPVPVFKCQDWLDIGLAQNSTSNFAFSPIETKTFFGAWYLKT